ncbi:MULTISPECIES: hypothetical protein [unclassified Arthrobacter]|uniref:hypothetical protein n=1 Tax=unclassified Arthrobacter TaxID=235627 RepID=UPI0014924776|nr:MULTISPECIES: hypothetical protein [unclassified Arthrobacter]MBE0009594.1 hypothetical protein [Arthrobacter sp. AET 35A]NOJ63344.1 hypothetical protein [Arthrobacter sp. 147(2020)]
MSEQPAESTEWTEENTEETKAQEAKGTEEETTEEVFDAERAREKIRKANGEAKNLRDRALAAEEKAKDAEGKDTRITTLEAENLRLRVGVKHGLPEALIKRLSGTTEEEILKDAEELMELFGPKKPPTNRPSEKLRGGGDPTSEPEERDLDKLAQGIFR